MYINNFLMILYNSVYYTNRKILQNFAKYITPKLY